MMHVVDQQLLVAYGNFYDHLSVRLSHLLRLKLLILVSNVLYHELKIKNNVYFKENNKFNFKTKYLLTPYVFQKPVGGTSLSVRRGAPIRGKLFLSKLNEVFRAD